MEQSETDVEITRVCVPHVFYSAQLDFAGGPAWGFAGTRREQSVFVGQQNLSHVLYAQVLKITQPD